jgi:hypothetical protein
VSLSCATVIDWAMGPYAGKQTGEAALLWTLLDSFKPGDVMIADRLYTSYFMIARLRQLGVDVVMRQHQTRHTDFRRGTRLGTRDHIVQWNRPVRPPWMDEDIYADMPTSLAMREVRAGGWTLVTSLVDAKSVSKSELVDLYHSRWHVELDFRSIKDAMQMDELRCKTAHGAQGSRGPPAGLQLGASGRGPRGPSGSSATQTYQLQGHAADTHQLLPSAS